MHKNKLLIFFVATLFVSSCKQNFNPNGAYEKYIVLFSILRMDTDTQYVRLYTTYDPNKSNPLTHTTDMEISDATVTVSDSINTYTFHDTLLVRADTTTRYGKYVHAYVAYKFIPKNNRKFTISVFSQSSGSISAQTIMPSTGSLSYEAATYGVLQIPMTSTDTAVVIKAKLGINAPVYAVRFYIQYKELVNGVFQIKRAEVPYYVRQGDRYDNFTATYPVLAPKGFRATTVVNEEAMSFSKEAYITMLRYLKNTVGPSRIQFDKAYFILNQVDQSTYSYYTISNQISDRISLRLDQIDFTNIVGGFGLFGSMTNIEISVLIPPDFEL